MSPNIQEGLESPSRKRSHEDYLDHDTQEGKPLKGFQLRPDAENMPVLQNPSQASSTPPAAFAIATDSPPSGSPASLLTDAGSITPARPSPSPNPTPSRSASALSGPLPQLIINIDSAPSTQTTAAANGQAPGTSPSPSKAPSGAAPAAKRKRLTPAEREEKAKSDAARKLEKEKAEAERKKEKERVEAARKQERDEQKAAAEAEKRARADEREKKRKQKEEEDRRKAEEKEKKRREKEEEERKVQEAKNKKERSQLRLNSFFKTGMPATPKKMAPLTATGTGSNHSSPTKASPQKTPGAGMSGYDRLFKPFFVKENVIMTTSLYGMDDETKAAKSRILDEYLSGARGTFLPEALTAAGAVAYFHLPCQQRPRGRKRATVRKIMSLLADADVGDRQNPQTKMALDLLKNIPMKFLGFREDVRPPYYGTATNIPPSSRLKKLARNPLAKTVLPLSYDYDSEAEWVDDDDGEDVDDLDEEEEELDEDEEMAGFLDDSEDAAPIRPAFSGGLEPESTGLCWESERRRGPQPDMETFRMEFILDHDGPVDPFSTQYWEPAASEPPPESTATAMAPPPVPGAADAFALLGTPASGKADPKKAVVAAEYMDDFKRAIVQYAKLSKIGIVEILSAEFGKCTKNQIKNSLEAMAERTGAGQQKTWKLKAGFAL